LASLGQQALRQLIGFLSLAPVSPNSSNMLAFRRGLEENGFFEGQNISFEFRAAGEFRGRRDDQLRQLAEDLLSQHPAGAKGTDGYSGRSTGASVVPQIADEFGAPRKSAGVGHFPTLGNTFQRALREVGVVFNHNERSWR
jgi:hypothetical protein